jgi:16S rRNA (adenine1518-N6/adenine1519-N6)-dimethyltransferase
MTHAQARKRFGQHFLVDEAVIEQIIRAIAPRPEQMVVEIGPGLSALTAPLMSMLDHLTVVEIDRDLIAGLHRRFPADRLTVVQGDVLGVDFSVLGDRLRIVGNLPYNISSPLLFHLRAYADKVIDQHFMLQREVVDRLVAQPATHDYGRLSVMLQSRYRIRKLFDVSPDAFDPPPRVVSSVVRMVPLSGAYPRPKSETAFEQVVARAFGQRRKMLRRGLGDWTALIDWDALGAPATSRAEELTVHQFIALSDQILEAGALQA